MDTYTQLPLHLDPQSKTISLHPASTTPTTLAPPLQKELLALNTLHKTMQREIENTAKIPPPPMPLNPKRSAAISKLRQNANTALQKHNIPESLQLYNLALSTAERRPPWEPGVVQREELAVLYANRAQAHMSEKGWAEAYVDAMASVECKAVGNPKAWWRGGKALVEMGRWNEARDWVQGGVQRERGVKGSEEGLKELVELEREIERKVGGGR
ncbi:MAG: hypothetical protein M1834_007996 [Cirrosporium novae-zelandiae]|nr:MAG: hypothetical protein M1834_007996 [Cirrosporium novae-zelandiae]